MMETGGGRRAYPLLRIYRAIDFQAGGSVACVHEGSGVEGRVVIPRARPIGRSIVTAEVTSEGFRRHSKCRNPSHEECQRYGTSGTFWFVS